MKKIFLTSLLVLLALQFSYSQEGNNAWTKYGPNMGRIYCGVLNPVNQSIIYVAGLDSGVFKTTNGGLNWAAVNNGLTSKRIQCIAIAPSDPNVLYVGTDTLGTAGTNGVYRTTNGGNNWTLVIGGLTEFAVQSMVVHTTNPNIVWACIFNAIGPAINGLWKTTNGGTNWFASNTGIASDNKNALAIAINPLNPNVLYMGTSLIVPGSTGPSKIYKSFDGGANWNLMSTGLPTLTTDNNPVRCLDVLKSDTSIVGAALFVNAVTGGFFLSTNGGQLWTRKHDGLPSATGSLLRSLNMRSANEYYVGMDGGTTTKGVWRTTNGGNNWLEFNNNAMSNLHPVRMLLFKTSGDTTLYAGASGTVDSLKGVYGYTWPSPAGYFTNFENYTVGQRLACQDSLNWTTWSILPCNTTEDPLISSAQSFSPTKSVVITQNNDLVKRYGNDTTGTHEITFKFYVPTGKAGYWNTLANFAGSSSQWGMECYFDVGATGNNGRLFGGSSTAVPFAYTHGAWQTVTLLVNLNADSAKFVINGNLIHKWRWTAGANGTAVPKKLSASDFFGATATDEMYMDNFSYIPNANWIITGVTQNGNNTVPTEYALSQNYPNPFNPTTKINFALPKSGLITMKVFNILGKEVATLVNEVRNAGSYTVDFDASNLTSGTYFYRLESNGFIDTKKMMLIK